MAEFLRAGRNEEILLAALGRLDCEGSHLFDALEYDGRPARTWREAFVACAGGRSVGGTRQRMVGGKHRVTRTSRVVRRWADFDLGALRALDPALEGLELPAEVYEAQADAALEAWEAGLADLDGYADAAQAAWYSGGADEEPAVASDDGAWLSDADALALLEACSAVALGEGEIEVDESMVVEEMDDDGWRWARAA